MRRVCSRYSNCSSAGLLPCAPRIDERVRAISRDFNFPWDDTNSALSYTDNDTCAPSPNAPVFLSYVLVGATRAGVNVARRAQAGEAVRAAAHAEHGHCALIDDE